MDYNCLNFVVLCFKIKSLNLNENIICKLSHLIV